MKSSLGWFALVMMVVFAAMIIPTSAQTAPVTYSLSQDTIIYVSDFELSAQNVTVDKGGVIGRNRPGTLERLRKKEQQDPEAQAKKLVNVMAENLIADLQKAVYKAQRRAPGGAQPYLREPGFTAYSRSG
jgi:hypothetical protein